MNFKAIALVAAALSAAALAPSTAEARCRGCGTGAAVVGGLALGAIIGSSIANSQPRYVEEPVYAPAPRAYYAPEYVEGPVCHMERQRFWDGYSWRHRRVEVCD
ncbi:MAG: hypothetical protein Q7T81_00310 [Pseudolabrys sp.]|nr:hypothetical protein [Pseudolabrys sp.]